MWNKFILMSLFSLLFGCTKKPAYVEGGLYLTPRKGGGGMGQLPLSHKSFEGWHAIFVQQSRVAEGELEGYAMWKEANGGYF